eukprot:9467059-Pyramimonas_sp.AAC.1
MRRFLDLLRKGCPWGMRKDLGQFEGSPCKKTRKFSKDVGVHTPVRRKKGKSILFSSMPLPMMLLRWDLGGVSSFCADHPCKKYTFYAALAEISFLNLVHL